MSFSIPLADKMRIAISYIKFKANEARLRTNAKINVRTSYGVVRGVKWRALYGGEYFSFEGIPYAKPPIGELRFKAPVRPEKWHHVRNCTKARSKPCQLNVIVDQMQGHEDCLYLNVYTKNVKNLKPVLVWIYGGGFQMGEASRLLYSPDYFMMKDVVLVTVAYRLGPLGFLSLGDRELDVPGNAGLKDQLMALEWVKENCHLFGGDPKKITVFGESAGATSVHYLMCMKQTKEIINSAVMMSGTALMPWSLVPSCNWAYRLARAIGYKGELSDHAVLQFLRGCKPSRLIRAADDIITDSERGERRVMFAFGPTIEPYDSPHCVISKPPLDLMREAWSNAAMPLLLGGNADEGLLMGPEVAKYPWMLSALGDCRCLTPFDTALEEDERMKCAEDIRRIYFDGKQPTSEDLSKYFNLASYKYFWHGIHRTLLSRAHYAPDASTYLYRFAFDCETQFSFMRLISCGRKARGVCHGDDLSYLFYNAAAKKLKPHKPEFKVIKNFVSIMVRFADQGDPDITLGETKSSSQNGHTNGARADDVQPNSRQLKQSSDLSDRNQDRQSSPRNGNGHANGGPRSWLPIKPGDNPFQCMNISEDLRVVDLPEAEDLKTWDSMYRNKSDLF